MHKGPRAVDLVQLTCWLVDQGGVLLTLVTLPHILAASLCIRGHQNPWVIARCASERPPTWLSHTPSYSLAKSPLTFSRCKHKRYGPPKDLWYNLRFADSQYWLTTWRTLLASFSSSGTWSSAKKSIIGSIQHGRVLKPLQHLLWHQYSIVL